jgi:glycosyltransferase involved in cell wall biosynthesis
MRRIRVAHLITNFKLGGAQDYLLQIVNGLDRNTFDPLVAGRMEGEWVPLVKSLDGVRSFDIPALRREIAPCDDVRAILEVKRFCRQERVDVLHTHSSKAGVVGRLGAALSGTCAAVHTVHGFSFNDFMPWWRKTFFIGLERFMSRFTTSLLVVSNGDYETALKLGIGAKRSVETFYYGIDFAPFNGSFDRTSIRREFGYAEHHRVIGFTGRFSEQKGLPILLEAFAQVHTLYREARLLLVGDGPLKPLLEEAIIRLNLQEAVRMTGFRSDIAEVLSAMDLFAMTSYWEGLSRSLAEAMFARLPVVATDVGGTRDAVRNGETGWLIPAGSVPATVAAIAEAFANPARARAMAECGYRWAREAFDVATSNKRVAELYQSLYAEHEAAFPGQRNRK